MNISSVINQLDVLVAIAGDLKTYLESVVTANTHADVEGYVDGINDALHDKHTWYGVSEFVIEDITQAKMMLANAKSLIYQTTDIPLA